MGANVAQFKRGFFLGLGFLTAALSLVLLIHAHEVFLLVFGSVLLAVVLSWMGRGLSARLHIPYGLAVLLVVLLVLGALVAFGIVSGPYIAEQMDRLGKQLPQAVRTSEAWLKQYDWGQYLLDKAHEGPGLKIGDLLGGTATIFTFSMSLLLKLLLATALTLYLTVSASVYYDRLFMLLPENRQERAGEVAYAVGRALRWWFVGQLISMAVIGVLTGAGLYLLGVPLAMSLGLLSFLFCFVPLIGALASYVPAFLVALLVGWPTALYVTVLYVAVHLLEAYVLTPLLQKRIVSIPPVLLIAAQVLMGFLAGIPGILLATPLMVAGIVLVQMLYVHDVLGRPAHPLGDRHG